jgi:hypothetical protein
MTEPRRPGRPATGQVPVRTVRVGHVWDQAHEIAKARRERFADVVESALSRYVARHRDLLAKEADQ